MTIKFRQFQKIHTYLTSCQTLPVYRFATSLLHFVPLHIHEKSRKGSVQCWTETFYWFKNWAGAFFYPQAQYDYDRLLKFNFFLGLCFQTLSGERCTPPQTPPSARLPRLVQAFGPSIVHPLALSPQYLFYKFTPMADADGMKQEIDCKDRVMHLPTTSFSVQSQCFICHPNLFSSSSSSSGDGTDSILSNIMPRGIVVIT